MRYQTLLLDADGTLWDFDRAEQEAIRETLRQFGLPDDQQWVGDYHRINAALWKQLERGEVTKAQLRTARFSRLLQAHGAVADDVAMADAYVETLSQKSYLLPGALEACQQLAEHCRLYLVTNGMAVVQRGRLARSPITPLMRECFISEEVGFEKPHKGYFEAVFRSIPQFDARTTLMVGDSLTSDMAGGIAAGLDTCWINPEARPIPEELPITYSIASVTLLPALITGKEVPTL